MRNYYFTGSATAWQPYATLDGWVQAKTLDEADAKIAAAGYHRHSLTGYSRAETLSQVTTAPTLPQPGLERVTL
jgi:hypothetical protein